MAQPASGGGRLNCSLRDFVPTEFGAVVGVAADRATLVENNFYWLICTNASGETVVQRGFQWVPGTTIIGAAELADRAVRELPIRYATPQTSPAIAIDHLVGIDTWMWVDPAFWQPVSATAGIPGLAVTATATPERVEWDMGDGTVVTCDGPGTPFDDALPEAVQSTDCSHLFQDRGAYTASATVTWTIAWTATDGDSGTLADVERTTQFPLRVVERQAVGR